MGRQGEQVRCLPQLRCEALMVRRRWAVSAYLFLMKLLPLCVLCFVSYAYAAEPLMERRILSDGNSAKSWSVAEGTMESASDTVKTAGPSLHWHVTVDHFAGEPNYPIGWPRVAWTLKGEGCDWSGWDYLHCWIHVQTSRKTLPRVPAVLSIRQGASKSSPYMQVLSDLKKDEWLEVRVPISKLAEPSEVRALQFNIAEDQYHHQDTLDFHIDDLVLLRYAEPTLADFAAVSGVMFSDAKFVRASFTLSGVKPEESRRVSLQWKRAGQVLAKGEFDGKRGPQQFTLDLNRITLKPGEYELTGSVGGSAPVVSRVSVIESPWH